MKVAIQYAAQQLGIFCTVEQATRVTDSVPEGTLPVYPPGTMPLLRQLPDNETGAVNPDRSGTSGAWVIEFQENRKGEDGNHFLERRQMFCSKLYTMLTQIPAPAVWKWDSTAGDLNRGH